MFNYLIEYSFIDMLLCFIFSKVCRFIFVEGKFNNIVLFVINKLI